MLRNITVISAALLLSGCATHLESVSVDKGDPKTRQGIAYFLPFTQFTVTTTWTIGACGQSGPELTAEVTAKAGSAADPDALHVIDYQALSAWTKTSSVKVDFYDSGAIKSINASADDKTGEIIASIASSVGKLGAFAVGGLRETKACSQAVNDALNNLPGLKDTIRTATEELALEQSALETLTAELVGKGLKADDPALEGLSTQIRKVASKQLALKAAQKKLANEMKALTYSADTLFPATSSQTEGAAIAIPEETYKAWLAPAYASSAKTQVGENAIYLKLELPQGLAGGKDFESNEYSESEQRRAGLRYRVAVPASLLACKQYVCGSKDAPADMKEPIARLSVRALLRDTTFYLPFKSEPFSSGGLTAAFSEGGVLTSAGYEQKRAQGEALMSATGTIIDNILTIGKAQRDAAKSELDQIKAATDLAKAKKDLATAQAALDKSPLADQQATIASLSAGTEIKKAEVASIEADIALAKAKAELAGLNQGK